MVEKDIKNYCSKCKNDTNQNIVFYDSELDTKEIFFESLKGDALWIIEKHDWTITKCKGCGMLNMQIKTSHIGKDNLEWIVNIKLIPWKIHHTPPKWVFSLDKKYILILSEIYTAYNNDLFRLTAMGIRTILDMLMIDAIGDIGSFEEKIKIFEKEGHINKTQKKIFETVIEVGNASSHRWYNPEKNTLNDLLEIIEHLLQTKVLEIKSNIIKNNIPTRKKINKT